ncbi:DUF3598 family protein [Halotia branconii]|uniref:DUF3598 family protein n=1 Tax=Halotia branconii CENA392 TaxID=1539056 RepID=A0AAJ6NWK2_9CYAN|nr:DUF3598 family protein [Halotia branconii]WGV27952.1 DUF3598 family protein [Halotia branconii CENA392]
MSQLNIMNTQEQNWINLFGNHSLEDIAWYGTWTKYAPNKKVISSFQGVRKFRTNKDKTLIDHTNTYTYADGSTEEKNWQLEKQTCNQSDGVIHVAVPSMRSLSFGQGASAWFSQTWEMGKMFGAELFFQHENWRTSVSTIYGENGDLERITHIREHLGSFPIESPGLEIEAIDGKWTGEKKYMTPDLIISDTELIAELILVPIKGINKTIFLPDGVVVNAPKKLENNQEFQMTTGKFVSPEIFKRFTVKYNQLGNFQQLISETFHRQV